jgi:tetratricopeptide (TPR) repeat protein
MIVAQFVQRVLNGPSSTGLAVAAAVGVALLLGAVWTLAAGKPKGLPGSLSAVGLATILGVLALIHEQTVQFRAGESVMVTRPRYSEGKRTLARVGLIALPGVAVLVALAAWAESKRRLRSRVPRHLKLGRKLFLTKEYDAALAEYNHALQIAPYLGEAYYGRACVYHARGEIALAQADLDHALQCDPRLYPAYLERARIRTETGDFDGALGDFDQLMIIRGNDPELYLNRGICLVKKGQVTEAVTDFHRVLKLTNHSDYADPAKEYLRRYEAQAQPAQPAAESNGAPPSTAMPEPKTEDYVL